jgi:hypothetical protein
METIVVLHFRERTLLQHLQQTFINLQEIPRPNQIVPVQGGNLVFIDLTDVVTAVVALRQVQNITRICFWNRENSRLKEDVLLNFFQLAQLVQTVENISAIF